MLTIKRMNGKELFDTKEEVINYFGEDFNPSENGQGDIVISNENKEMTISSLEDWEDFKSLF